MSPAIQHKMVIDSPADQLWTRAKTYGFLPLNANLLVNSIQVPFESHDA